jgi:autotransporter translocation and assembly factor TamB
MRAIRRLLHVVAWVGTLAVALVALALIVSQTPWFRDWLRRYIVREAKQYLNGELTIGQLSGNLFFGVQLSDVAIDVSGDRVVAVKTLGIDYSVFDIVSQGIILDEIALAQPVVHLERDIEGWNVGRLIREQRREAEREGPGRPISLPSIVITDGAVVIDDRTGSPSFRFPQRIDNLNVKAGFEYAPVHYSIDLRELNLRASEPDLSLQQLAGKIAVRDDNLYVERLLVRTEETSMTADGVIAAYRGTPHIKLATSGTLSMPEGARILPALAGYNLHPAFDIKSNGTTDRLGLDLDVKSEAGRVHGQVTADVRAPDFGVSGPLYLERLNLAPILQKADQRSDITGEARVGLTLPSTPAATPAIDRLGGTFTFRGPRVVALGYQASQVEAAGSFKGPRINLSSSRVRAYGGSATAKGLIVLPGVRRPVTYDLQGSADGVDLRLLPPSIPAPNLATKLSVAEYHVTGTGATVSGSVTLNTSEVEGATIADGTVAEFSTGRGPFSYAARGTATGLELRRIGRALEIEALDQPLYDGRLNGTFDVKASGTALAELDLEASGTLTDSTVAGTHLSEMTFESRIADRALSVKARGGFDALNPAVLLERKAVEGNMTGRVDATFRMADLSAPTTQDSMAVDGRVTFAPSLLGGVQIAGADIEGRFASAVGDIRRLHIQGPDVTVEASGRLSLDRTTASDLKYHLEAADLTELGRIAGQRGLDGSLVLDGTISGNAESLQTAGTMKGNSVAWSDIKVLDLNSEYGASVPDLDFARAKVQAKTNSTFVTVAGQEINQLSATTTYDARQLDFTTHVQERSRELDATGRVIFHPDHQEIHLPQLVLRTDGIEWRNVEGTEATVQYAPGQITLKDIKLTSGDQTLDVGGVVALTEGKTGGDLTVQARNVDLAQLERLLLQDRGLSGRLTADAKISGTTEQPVVDGHVEIRNGGFQTYRYESLIADVDYASTRIELDAVLQQSPGISITAKGTVPTSAFARGERGHVAPTTEDQIDVRLQTAGLNLGFIQGFTTRLSNVGGTLAADVRITGAGRDPHLVGWIDIRDGAFAVPAGGLSYSGLDTRIDLEPDLVRIRRFEILDENGEQLAVAGQLAVHERQVGAIDVTLESTNFEIIDNELGDVQVDANLKVTGELLRPKLEGDVRIAAGRLEVDRILQLFYDPYAVEAMPDVVSAERAVDAAGSAEEATRRALAQAEHGIAPVPELPPEPPSAKESSGPLAPVSLDVRVRIPDNLLLRGRKLRPGGPTRATLGDINITVGGDFSVRKDPDMAPTLTGTITTVRGQYQFQGRQFDLVRGGTLRFTGEPEINPILDVTATRNIPDTGIEARVRLTGTVKTPELTLSSTPPLEESDVLALIIFNRPLNELGTGERASLAATAGGIATGFIATPLGESIGRALKLDLFEITTTTEGDTLGAGITVGQQIWDRAFLKVRQQFGERTLSEFVLEYQLADFMRLVGSAAPESSGAANRIGQRRIERAGIDLIFFFSY